MGNQGFNGEARAPAQSFIVQERNNAAISYLNATTQVRRKPACIIGKPTEGYRRHTQRNLTRTKQPQ